MIKKSKIPILNEFTREGLIVIGVITALAVIVIIALILIIFALIG